jgi:hypothetical protein
VLAWRRPTEAPLGRTRCVPCIGTMRGARELPIGWRSSTIAVALRQRERRLMRARSAALDEQRECMRHADRGRTPEILVRGRSPRAARGVRRHRPVHFPRPHWNLVTPLSRPAGARRPARRPRRPAQRREPRRRWHACRRGHPARRLASGARGRRPARRAHCTRRGDALRRATAPGQQPAPSAR